jgi:hypothetical protein
MKLHNCFVYLCKSGSLIDSILSLVVLSPKHCCNHTVWFYSNVVCLREFCVQPYDLIQCSTVWRIHRSCSPQNEPLCYVLCTRLASACASSEVCVYYCWFDTCAWD